MELNKFDRQLKLIELLIDNQHLSIEEIGNTIGLSTRSVYRYIQFFENLGFEVFNDKGIYSIGHNSPFITAISQKMHFTSEELEPDVLTVLHTSPIISLALTIIS